MRLLGRVLNFFFPVDCFFCGRLDFYSKRVGVCKHCGDFSFYSNQNLAQVCEVCGFTLQNGECEFCESRNIFFTKLFFLKYREQKDREILHAIKFQEEKILSNYFRLRTWRVISKLKELHLQGIVSVPSNKASLRKRPYHVCGPLLEKLHRSLQIPVLNILIKESNELQSGKNFFQRFIHARFAFSIQEKFQNTLAGNYLLVDDLFTTGASINECARILLENGAKEVYVLTLLKVKA